MMELRTENLVVGYDKAPLIKDVNLKVVSGQVLTLIGPNGAGKSTILKTITRQLKRIGGTIYLGQESMNNMRDSEVSKSLSMVMTERLQTELLTGRDVVASGRYPYTGRFGILSKEDWEKVDEAIALVHAQDVQDQDFRKMSDGQRQRLMLARAICQDTDILLLDEPTSYLDMGFKLDILANIRMLARERNLAIIMSLHELDLKVFVIGGCGSGIAAYNRLQRENVPFVAGILQKNDLEYPTARALAAEVVSQKAFYPIEKAQIEEAKKWMEQCETCICTLPMEAFGPLNEANRELLEYAKEIGKLSM